MVRLSLWKKLHKPKWCEHCQYDRIGEGEVCPIVKFAQRNGKDVGSVCSCDGKGKPPSAFVPKRSRGRDSMPDFTVPYIE